MTRYMCILKGGSIGESRDRKPNIFNTKEDAQAYGKRYVKSFSGGSRNYYRPGYSVKPVSERDETRGKITWMGVEFNL